MEFKATFPTNTAVLGKTIAAFASTDGGTIYIGVGDGGDLVGLPGAESPQGRDGLTQRIEGICSGPIRPAVQALVKWGLEDEMIVMVIGVPRGSQPIYYHGNIPYIRHLTSSRPAEPQEVIERILSRLPAFAQPHAVGAVLGHEEEIAEWVGTLANALLPVLIYSDEIEYRLIDPWLTMWMADFKGSAELLRELRLGNETPSTAAAVIDSLLPKLEKLSRFRMYLGCGPELMRLMNDAAGDARNLWEQYVDPNLTGDREEAIRSAIHRASTKLEDLSVRGREMLFTGESGEFQSAVASVGHEVLRMAYLALGISNEAAAAFFGAARGLHLVETDRLYLDGGESQEKLLSQVGSLHRRLVDAAGHLKV